MTPAGPGALARAKVNLSLRVVGRRPDGYHLLDSVVVFAGIGDALCAEPANRLHLEITGPFGAELGAGADNLVLRAAQSLADAAGVRAGARITLNKRLPVASGIGGGSADAAATLGVLTALWGLRRGDAGLASVAASLGADVPVCLAGRPARMRGIGERVDRLPPVPPAGLVLVNPGIAVSTPAVFRALSDTRAGPFAAEADPPAWPDAEAMAAWLRAVPNDLQPSAIALCPAIAGVLDLLHAEPGCLLARMSGSGATCFGLFRTAGDAQAAAARMARPGWWCWGGPMER